MKNPNGCTGENCPLVNPPENGCKSNVCPWFTKDEQERTIYGYPVRELAILAETCRLQGIQHHELHEFVLNLGGAFEIVMKSFQDELDRTIRKAFENEKRLRRSDGYAGQE